jgi:lipopolysaccharide export system permease protein
MKTVRRLLYRDVVSSVCFVALAFLALFFFIDFVDELDGMGKRGRSVWQVIFAAALEMPGHLYDLSPIAVLIGTIYALARLAQSSEFTILRTSGLGPGRALMTLATIGVVFGVITYAVGDYVAPAAERLLARMRAESSGGLRIGGAGAWLKEHRSTAEGERSYSINVGGTSATGALDDVLIFEFDPDGRLLTRTGAKHAHVDAKGLWTLRDAIVTRWPLQLDGPPNAQSNVQEKHHDSLTWESSLGADVVAAAVLPLATMTTLDLWRYSEHLSGQEQATQSHEIRFWNKALYPFASLVMVALALPFAYLHARAGGVSLKVFGGIMLGISFVLLNKLAGHIGLLRDWTPWVAASTPSLLYLLMSMAAFAWLVRYR